MTKRPKIVIDTRETRSKVPKILEKFADVEYQTLTYGDYAISDNIVFERKSFSDWEGSVIDGRIFRQAEGLRENYKQPFFILEGGPKYGGSVHTRPKLTKAALHSSFLSVGGGFNIPIIPTNNPTESANLIIQAARREQVGKENKPINVLTHKKATTESERRRQIFSCFSGIGPKLATELDAMPYSLMQIFKAIDQCEIDKLGKKKKENIQNTLRWSPC